MFSQVQTALSNPRLARAYATRKAGMVRALVAHGEYELAARYLGDLLAGGNRLRSHLASNEGARYVDCEVLDFRMRVDLLDEGLSWDLLIDGYREPLATAQYQSELDRLAADRDTLTVVDVGANIGYFALVALSQCRADVVAIEPHPETFSLLGENVRGNGFEAAVDCHQCAVGAASRSATLQVARQRNLCATTEPATDSHYVDEISVPMRRLDELLADTDTPVGDVDVLRMDVQGYEYEVFRGARRVLSEGNVGLIFVEVHPWYLREREEYDGFLTMLADAGFELVFAADGRTAYLGADTPTYADRELDVETLDELRDIKYTVELLLRG